MRPTWRGQCDPLGGVNATHLEGSMRPTWRGQCDPHGGVNATHLEGSMRPTWRGQCDPLGGVNATHLEGSMRPTWRGQCDPLGGVNATHLEGSMRPTWRGQCDPLGGVMFGSNIPASQSRVRHWFPLDWCSRNVRSVESVLLSVILRWTVQGLRQVRLKAGKVEDCQPPRFYPSPILVVPASLCPQVSSSWTLSTRLSSTRYGLGLGGFFLIFIYYIRGKLSPIFCCPVWRLARVSGYIYIFLEFYIL